MRVLFRLFILLHLLIASAELASAEGGKVRVGDIDIPQKNPDFSLLLKGKSDDEKRALYPWLLHYLMRSGERAARDNLILFLTGETDPIAGAYGRIAGVYFSGQPHEEMARRLRKELKPLVRDHGAALIAFHASLLEGAGGVLAKEEALLPICSVPSEREVCTLVRLGCRMNTIIRSERISLEDLKSMADDLRPYLSGNRSAPFFERIAANFPQKLLRMGFPLESALLAGFIQKGDSHRSGRPYAEMPEFLIGAGDLANALRVIEQDPDLKKRYRGEVVDWMLLTGENRAAAELADRIGPEALLSEFAKEGRDYWTGGELTPEILQMKMAVILFLAGDQKKGLKMLERLSSIQTKNKRGEPYRLYARLRMAQIVLRDNPELSHRIAEDVSYIAQENGWDELEYIATILDGWAHYFAHREFHATVNFVKSKGILSNPDPESDFSRKLGTLCINSRGGKRKQQDLLLREIHERFLRDPAKNDAYFMLRNWLPISSRELFIKEASIYYEHSGQGLEALNLFISYHNQREYYFPPRENPGGMRGLGGSLLWIGTLDKVYNHRKSASPFRLAAGMERVLGEIDRRYGGRLSESDLKEGTTYLFGFRAGSDRRVFRIRRTDKIFYYGRGRKRRGVKKKIWDVDSIRIEAGRAAEMLERCAAPSEGCGSIASDFADVAPARGERLRILFDPEFDLDYGKIFPAAGELEFFYRPVKRGRVSSIPAVREIVAPEGCEAVPRTDLIRSIDYSARFIRNEGGPGEILFWPEAEETKEGSRSKPIYLRGFSCGQNLSIRMWEIDRNSDRTVPSGVIFKKMRDPELERVFARHFVERGALLMRALASPSQAFYAGLLKKVPTVIESMRSVVRGENASGSGRVYLIVPGITD